MVAQYLAFKMITRNLEKAFFSLFGILIGVASIVAILSISAGGKSVIQRDLDQIGERRVIIQVERGTVGDTQYLNSLSFVERAYEQNRTLVVDLKNREDWETVVVALKSYNPLGRYEAVVDERRDTVDRIRKNLSSFLKVLGAVALILGGLSISNLMSSQVQKKQGTIGMLMAMGADENFIFQMFLTEGIILSSLGAVLGGGFGVVLAVLLGKTIGIPSVVNMSEIAGVVLGAVVMGGVFGLFPARRASKLNPVEAIRK